MTKAWVLLVIGAALIIEGTVRIALGVLTGSYLLSFGGVLTGWLLGGWLFRKGYRTLRGMKAAAPLP